MPLVESSPTQQSGLARRELLRVLAGAGAWAAVSWLARARPARAETAEPVPFDDEMMAHSRWFCPFLANVVGEEQLRAHIRTCWSRAAGYGFTLRGPIRTFIEMTFLLGSSFDSDPQTPWAGEVLRAEGAEMARAEQLYAETVRYQESLSLWARRRALAHGIVVGRTLPAISDERLVSGHIELFDRVFPEKASYVGEKGLTALIHDGAAAAEAAGLSSQQERTLVIALMFGFGRGCLQDPLLPMIAPALEEARRLGPKRGAAHLQKTAIFWMARAVTA